MHQEKKRKLTIQKALFIVLTVTLIASLAILYIKKKEKEIIVYAYSEAGFTEENFNKIRSITGVIKVSESDSSDYIYLSDSFSEQLQTQVNGFTSPEACKVIEITISLKEVNKQDWNIEQVASEIEQVIKERSQSYYLKAKDRLEQAFLEKEIQLEQKEEQFSKEQQRSIEQLESEKIAIVLQSNEYKAANEALEAKKVKLHSVGYGTEDVALLLSDQIDEVNKQKKSLSAAEAQYNEKFTAAQNKLAAMEIIIQRLKEDVSLCSQALSELKKPDWKFSGMD